MKVRRIISVAGSAALGVIWALPASAQIKPHATPHDIEGQEQCLMCHAAGALEPVPDVPADHEGRTNETCQWCHAPDSPMLTSDPGTIPHDLEGQEQCLMCHTAGAMEPVPDVPANHEGRENEHCRLCHKPAGQTQRRGN